MPGSQLPSSFASAAAGQASSQRDTRNGRGDGRGSGDWATQRTRGPNGTVTLRRSSTAPYAKSIAEGPSTQTSETQTAPSYGSNRVIDLFRRQDTSSVDVSDLYTENWEPGHTNGTNGRGWGKAADGRETNGPDMCWDTTGKVEPFSLDEKTELEKAIFENDVNSTMKPPPQNMSKELNGQGIGANGRKTSIGQGSSPFGLSSPSSSRPSTRRQQTADSINALGSPAGNRGFSREDNNTSFSGRMLSRDGPDDRAENPFARGGLIRSNTGGSGLGNGPSSPSTWGNTPSSATVGSFGHFAHGGSGTPLTPGEKKPPFGSSRFGKLMTKESSEDVPSKAASGSWRGRQRTDTTDTDPYASDNPTGSAALGGGQDTSPPFSSTRRTQGIETPVRGNSSDFGMSDLPSFQNRVPSQTPRGQQGGQEPLSPDTNPYRSPPDARTEQDEDAFEGESQQNRAHGLGGIPEHGPNPFGHLPRGFSAAGFEGSDRSQNSSANANRAFPTPLGVGGLPSLSGLGSIGGWPSGNLSGTPDRENRSAFAGAFSNNSAFGASGDLQSPGFSNAAGAFGSVSASTNTSSSRRLASFLPAAMQAQMQANETDSPVEGGDSRHNPAFGTIGRSSAFSRDTDSSLRTGRSAFDDVGAENEAALTPGAGFFSSSDVVQGQTATAFPQGSSTLPSYQQSPDSASNQLPASQQRTMVMPDRMRWVYLDPQGQVQGPWSGLEMHDWYKAQFFSADLSVKKLEDTDFEPLGQLIRRIGNSREPFLVPQIGIQHGAPPTQPPFPPTANPSGAQVGTVQPPFAGAFPSFGTTLTAEQQNNLERRKQEEQYLMARQREFLAQQQVSMRQMQTSGLTSALHHQSSAHSLQSQPSFGSMTSPIGMPPQPPVQSAGGFFDNAPRQAPTSGISEFLHQEDLSRLNLQDRPQHLFSSNVPASQGIHAQQINALFGQHSDVQQQQQRDAARVEQARQEPRFREWEQLRSQTDLEDLDQPSASAASDPIGPAHQQQQFRASPTSVEEQVAPEPEVLSLSQQIQKTVSAKQSPHPAVQPDSPWTKVDPSMPMPFPPPPQSTTPLPAPTAQRSQSNLPAALTIEERSQSGTPEVTTAAASIAPWAKEPTEATRAPSLSLKEIQEAEAKQAAKAEEIAAANRRAQLEQEMRNLSSQPVAPAPGLPTTSTWGNTASPATPSAPSPWSTTSAKVPASSNAALKKTLADIQREEELRKQKAAAAAAAAQPVQGLSGGKRYADLASKPTGVAPTSASPWATVGAGGKVKIPTGPAASSPQTLRSSSSASIPTVVSRTAARPGTAPRSVTTGGTTSALLAQEEFDKWVKTSLRNGLPSNVDVDNFAESIKDFPQEVLRDAIYETSKMAMDGRHWAEEYMRRKKLAAKGIVEPSGTGVSASTGSAQAGGWNEVAKKGPQKEEAPTGYKVVPNKKKGSKK